MADQQITIANRFTAHSNNFLNTEIDIIGLLDSEHDVLRCCRIILLSRIQRLARGLHIAFALAEVLVPSIQGQSVFKISPNLERVVRAIHLEGVGNGVADGAGSVWVTAPRRDAVARIDPVSGRVAWIAAGDAPTDVCVSRGAVWVANSGARTVSRLEASTGKVVATVSVPRRPNRIAADERSVWVTFLGAP